MPKTMSSVKVHCGETLILLSLLHLLAGIHLYSETSPHQLFFFWGLGSAVAHCQQMCGLHSLARAQPWRVTSVDSSQVISGMAQDEPVTFAEATWWL